MFSNIGVRTHRLYGKIPFQKQCTDGKKDFIDLTTMKRDSAPDK